MFKDKKIEFFSAKPFFVCYKKNWIQFLVDCMEKKVIGENIVS